MKKIEHETSPEIAWKILCSGVFLCSQNPGDEGLNAVGFGGSGYFDTLTQARETGALLELEWSGPELPGRPEAPVIDTLYNEKPHRIFIPVGTTRHLMLTNIRLRTNRTWDEAVTKPTFPHLVVMQPCSLHSWVQSLAPDWKERQVAQIKERVLTLDINPVPLRIHPRIEPGDTPI